MLFRPIAVFDSGLGSLSVVRELRKVVPSENILYFADKLNFPYGTKSKAELKSIIHKSIKFLERYQPKLIVIASNTPSVQLFEEIKNQSSVDIIPTKPPIKKAVGITKKKHIAIMASKGTLNSKEFDYMVKKEIPQEIFVTKIDSTDIIDLVERGAFVTEKSYTFKTLKKTIEPNFEESIDVFVLASTHLPFVKNYLLDLLPSVKLVDSSSHVAKDVKHYLQYYRDLNKNNTGKLEILVSADKKDFQSVLRTIGVRDIIYDVSLQF
jgi:glutamate racemase